MRAPRQAHRAGRADCRGRAGRSLRRLRAGPAGRRYRRRRHCRAWSPGRIERARRDRRHPARCRATCTRASPAPSSPTRSPRMCSTGRASPSPAIPNISRKLAAEMTGVRAHPVMMLWSPELAVVPVTIHLPLREVVGAAHDRAGRRRPAVSWRAISRSGSASRARGSPSPASIRTPARMARWARRIATVVAPAVARLRARGHRRARAAARRHDVSCRGARDLRRRARDVSRPGADPDQDARLRPCRERHARPAVRAHLARPRHRLRHRRHRPRRSVEPDRRAAAGGAPVRATRPPRRDAAHERRSTICRRCARSSGGTAARQEVARPELPARSQPHRPHRPRRRPARRA